MNDPTSKLSLYYYEIDHLKNICCIQVEEEARKTEKGLLNDDRINNQSVMARVHCSITITFMGLSRPYVRNSCFSQRTIISLLVKRIRMHLESCQRVLVVKTEEFILRENYITSWWRANIMHVRT